MKRSVVMILLAGALTLSMIAPSALPAVAGNVSVVHAAAKISNTSPAETSNDAAVKASNDAAVKTSNDVTAETSNDTAKEDTAPVTETAGTDAETGTYGQRLAAPEW